MKLWEIWMEGYAATGEHGPAQKLGQYEAESFDDAVALLLEKQPEHKVYYTRGSLTNAHAIWGCQLYDNEQDARKSFG